MLGGVRRGGKGAPMSGGESAAGAAAWTEDLGWLSVPARVEQDSEITSVEIVRRTPRTEGLHKVR